MSAAVRTAQRWSAEHPCRICGGHDKAARGKGLRCYGFLGADGDWAHCTREESAGGLSLTKAETYAHRLEGACRCGVTHGEAAVVDMGGREIISRIDYDYENGVRVTRTDFSDGKKEFYQAHLIEGRYIKGSGPSPRTLYRAPELRAADRQAFVFIVEGEKCVDTLRLHGLVATTTIGGAGQFDRSAASAVELLRGRHVVLCPDNDDPGRRYCADVTKAIRPVARTYRVLELPGLEEGGDVVDWLRQGGTPEDLIRRAEATPDVGAHERTPLAAEAARRLWEVADPPAIPTGVDGLDRAITGLRAGSITVLNGPSGQGKSGLAIQIARHIASTGKEVVYLTSELPAKQVLARVAAQIRRLSWVSVLQRGPAEAESIARCLSPLALRVIEMGRDSKVSEVLTRVTDEIGSAPVVILDYLQSMARRLGSEDQRFAVGQISDQLVGWCRDTKGIALAVSSVAREKYKVADGTSPIDLIGAGKDCGEIEYDASAVMFLSTDVSTNGLAPAKLRIAKHRYGPAGQTIGLQFEGALGLFRDDPLAALGELEDAAYRAIEAGARTKNEVVAAVEAKRDSVLKAVDALMRMGFVQGPPLRIVLGGSC